MPKTRTLISWLIFIVALVVMVMPLPGQDQLHLMAKFEANDTTLVILTTDDRAAIQPLVDVFQDKYNADVRVITTDHLSQAAIQQHHADLVLARYVAELIPLADHLDTLAPDLLWNVDTQFSDMAGRWIGYAGRLQVIVYNPEYTTPDNLADIPVSRQSGSDAQHIAAVRLGDEALGWVDHTAVEAPLAMLIPANPQLGISAFALASSANSKPLAQLFLNSLYLPTAQRLLVAVTGQYSFSAFGVGTPANLPSLEELSLTDFARQYSTDYRPDSNRVAAIQ